MVLVFDPDPLVTATPCASATAAQSCGKSLPEIEGKNGSRTEDGNYEDDPEAGIFWGPKAEPREAGIS